MAKETEGAAVQAEFAAITAALAADAILVQQTEKTAVFKGPFGSVTEVSLDGEIVQVDVACFVKGYSTDQVSVEDLVRRVRALMTWLDIPENLKRVLADEGLE